MDPLLIGFRALTPSQRKTGKYLLLVAGVWAQLNAVFDGFAYARSPAFYDTMLLWQWLRIAGDVVFSAGAVLMAFDFVLKLRPMFPGYFRGLLPAILEAAPRF